MNKSKEQHLFSQTSAENSLTQKNKNRVARVNSRTPVMFRSELTAPNLKVSFCCDITISGSLTYVLTIQEITSSC